MTTGSSFNSRPPPLHPAPTVRLVDASLVYDQTVLFDHLSVDICSSGWTVLLGPSGVGKTTLLRLVAGLETNAEGRAESDDGRPLEGRISYMAQQDLLLPWLSLRQNALLGARLRRKNSALLETRADDLLKKAGLASAVDLMPSACSGGMRQRAALVRTLMEDRPIVLMDEPFSALDAITRLQLQDIAADLLSQRTVLLVTHDPLEALRLGHWIHVMTGRPARLGDAIIPDGPPPRQVSDPNLSKLQAGLLTELAEAARETSI
ncbi:MAG: ABC transporter ATP-binding protein [Pseudomonadota bacterium]|nr:ABC transporter ATP-binding protein [Pseudomonadota bacterium]